MRAGTRSIDYGVEFLVVRLRCTGGVCRLPLAFIVTDGAGIWHAEGGGTPHCIAVRPCSNTDIQIIDGRHVWSVSKIDAEKVFHHADDASTVVTFTWQNGAGGLHAALLDLCA